MRLIQDQELAILRELEASVDPKVETYWNGQIRDGLGGTPFTLLELAAFEAAMFAKAFGMNKPQPGEVVHYFGVGRGHGLKLVAHIVNQAGLPVIAFDTASEGCETATQVFAYLEDNNICPVGMNVVQKADIEAACQPKYIQPERGGWIVLPRVLGSLDNSSEDPEKMARTVRRIGALRLRTFVLHLELEGNESAMLKSATPSSLGLVAAKMSEGWGAPVRLTRLGTTICHEHRYTAGLFEA